MECDFAFCISNDAAVARGQIAFVAPTTDEHTRSAAYGNAGADVQGDDAGRGWFRHGEGERDGLPAQYAMHYRLHHARGHREHGARAGAKDDGRAGECQLVMDHRQWHASGDRARRCDVRQ
jgi:hypothetical protein